MTRYDLRVLLRAASDHFHSTEPSSPRSPCRPATVYHAMADAVIDALLQQSPRTEKELDEALEKAIRDAGGSKHLGGWDNNFVSTQRAYDFVAAVLPDALQSGKGAEARNDAISRQVYEDLKDDFEAMRERCLSSEARAAKAAIASAADNLAVHITSELIAIDLDSLLDLVPDTVTRDEYRLACKDHRALAALLLRVCGPVKNEEGGT